MNVTASKHLLECNTPCIMNNEQFPITYDIYVLQVLDVQS